MQLSITTIDRTEKIVDFSDFLLQSRYTVLYFYPKNNTSGCTIQAQEFTHLYKEFMHYDAQILGVSKDIHNSHCNFIEKHTLKITLASDPTLALHHMFGALGEKNMYGKTSIGTLRNTYLLDTTGTILYSRIKVSPRSHAQHVLHYIASL